MATWEGKPTLASVLKGYTPPTESPLADPIIEHFKSVPKKFAENQAKQMELLSQAFPGNTYESMMTQGDPKAMAELAMQTPFNAMIAYHGTPHNILGKFDISKVGTGEGAQAYGHGMYFAENPKVAEEYKNALKLNNNLDITTNGEYLAKKALEMSKMDKPQAIKLLQSGELENTKMPEFAAKNAVEQMHSKMQNPEGNLYKVDIPDEYIPNMLDWDKPLSEQPKSVQKALAKIDPDSFSSKGMDYDPTELGQAIYHRLKNSPLAKNDAEASALLNQYGIKGINYLDAGSRSKGGTSNFVVFDPSEVKILEKNSKPVSRKELIEEQVNKLK